MPPRQLKAARRKLRLSARQLAEALEMPGPWSDRTVRAWEGGEYSVPGHIADAVAGLLEEREEYLAREKAWRASVDMKPINAELRALSDRDRDVVLRVAKVESYAAVGDRKSTRLNSSH